MVFRITLLIYTYTNTQIIISMKHNTMLRIRYFWVKSLENSTLLIVLGDPSIIVVVIIITFFIFIILLSIIYTVYMSINNVIH